MTNMEISKDIIQELLKHLMDRVYCLAIGPVSKYKRRKTSNINN